MKPDSVVPEDKGLYHEIQAVPVLHILYHTLYSAAPLISPYHVVFM
jgi:hypothetical protein